MIGACVSDEHFHQCQVNCLKRTLISMVAKIEYDPKKNNWNDSWRSSLKWLGIHSLGNSIRPSDALTGIDVWMCGSLDESYHIILFVKNMFSFFCFTEFTAILAESDLFYQHNTLYNTTEPLILTIHFYMVYFKESLECLIFLIFSETENLVTYSIFARVHIGFFHCSFKIQISPLIQKSIFLLIICFDAMTLISKYFSLVDRLAGLNHIDLYVRLRDSCTKGKIFLEICLLPLGKPAFPERFDL